MCSSISGEEIYWYAGMGRKMTSDDITAETVQLTAIEKAPDAELVAAITSENGLLAAGSLPTSGGATAESDKNAWDSILKATTVKVKKNPAKKPKEEPEEMEPKSWKETLILS